MPLPSRTATSLWLLVAALLVSSQAGAQELPRLSLPSAGAAAANPTPHVEAIPSVIENGQECSTITFEGLGNQLAVPPINGINSPGWLSLIDADAGGTGNFAHEPSPETIMFWLGSDPSIVLDRPATKIEFFYSTSVTLTVTAFNDQNVQIAQITRPPNYLGGAGDPNGTYSGWSPLTVQVAGQKIKRLNVIGGPNYTGFDNLKVCSQIGVDSVELTQAIQQLQSIDDLKADLQGDREAPVPIVAGKPAALRVYLQQTGAVTPVRVDVTGAINATRVVSVQPQCTTDKQRLRQDGCSSADFYFTPTSGNFDITVETRDATNAVTETHALPFTARDTNRLKLKAVSVCDAQDGSGNWLCGAASALASRIAMLQKIAPTRSVTVETTTSEVRLATSDYGTINAWWNATTAEIATLYGLFDWASTALGTSVKYYGMIRPALPGGTGGQASDIPGHGAASRTSVTRLGVETNAEVVAHETGHTLGLRHTNTDVPSGASVPGCYNLAVDSSTDWPFANNRIQSTARLEVGYDVAARRALDPQDTYDIMSYCVPRWISPLRYKRLITALSGGAVTSPSIHSTPAAVGPSWLVSGAIVGGVAEMAPVFAIDAEQVAGEGTHVVNVVNAGGSVLASSRFTPAAPDVEASDAPAPGPPRFTVVVAQAAGASRLEIRSDADALLGTVTLGGVAPTVQLVSPAPPNVLTGSMLLTWAIADSDSASHTTRVQYSKDNGTSWANLAAVSGTQLQVDFDQLPGGSSTLIRLLVSDGANTGTTTAGPFTTPRKTTVATTMLSPGASAVVAPGTLFLEGVAHDLDDGVLSGASLAWSSNIAGGLGTGERVAVDLAPGTHVIQLVATDSDGNTGSAQVTVQVAGPAPQIDLMVAPANTLPTTCMAATLNVTAAGLPPALIEYSINGGVSWTAVPTSSLPYRFIVPGSGYFNLVARVTDAAGQSSADGEQFFTSAPCTQQVVVAPGAWSAPAAAASQSVTIITVVAGQSWTASTNQPWLSVTPTSGAGSGVLTIAVTATTSGATRTGTVTIGGRPVQVTQLGGTASFTVSPTTWAAPGQGGTQSVSVVSSLADAPWTAVSGASWLTVTPGAGIGSGSATVSATQNLGASRTGTVTIAGQTVTVTQGPTPPTALRVKRVIGNLVTLQWTYLGPATAGFFVTGGLTPGQVLAAIPTGSTSPIFTFEAPTGSFFVRVHAADDTTFQRPSNEVPLVVQVPTAPSAPANLLATVQNSRLDLAWTNTFGGGAPTGVTLRVAGAASAAFPLGLAESFSFDGVPPGTYTLSIVGSNAGGTGPASNAVTVTFPRPTCSGAPLPPSQFLGYRVGNTVFVVWEPAVSGPAPNDFVLTVAEFGLAIPTGGARSLSGTVGSGRYTLSVTARNLCGSSAPTPAQVVVVP